MTPSRPRPGATHAHDSGAATVLLLLLAPALFALAGLVLDGGRQLAGRQHAADLAEQAARAGADRLDTATLRATGTAQLDADAAARVACNYVRTVEPGASCTASVQRWPLGPQVRVQVRTVQRTVLLGLIGINAFHTAGTATAQTVTGIRTRLPATGAQP
jgi:Flp pilus assembly protein TadG